MIEIKDLRVIHTRYWDGRIIVENIPYGKPVGSGTRNIYTMHGEDTGYHHAALEEYVRAHTPEGKIHTYIPVDMGKEGCLTWILQQAVYEVHT